MKDETDSDKIGDEGQPVPPDFKTAMQETMAKLEARNQEYDGQLFEVFGYGDTRFFVFDTPAESVEVSNFLVVMSDGFRLIQVRKTAIANFIRLLERARNSRNNPNVGGAWTHAAKYNEEQCRLDFGPGLWNIKIDQMGAAGISDQINDPNIRLVEDHASSETVEEIVRLNKERVDESGQAKEAERQKIEALRETVDKIDEILG